MEPLIKAVSMAKTKGIPVKLLLVGKHLQTGYSLKVERWLRDYGVEDVTTWLNFIPHSEVPKYSAAIDVATIPFDTENPTAYYAAPNKLWEYLSQGAIVASTPIPEVIVYRHIRKLYIVRKPEDYVEVFEKSGRQRNRDIDPRLEEILKTRLWNNSAEKFKKILKSLVLTK
jgi:hypothetical protein